MLIENLPGREAQLLLAPKMRAESLKNEKEIPYDAVKSAVLVLLYPPDEENSTVNSDWELLLIERSTYNGAHSGQIAFPGGKQEPGEKDPQTTASREAFEELGIEQNNYSILGELTHIYIPITNFVIFPVLALSKNKTPYVMNTKEVAGYKRVPLKAFATDNIKTIKVEREVNQISEAPCYICDDYTIWGATAMIISELYQLIVDARVRISLSKPYISSSNVVI
jgi:8-oxo-dGTP pyrophosphatase MutT (NUDIX family)